MERRILTAFILSFIILTAWSALFPQPKNKMSKETQFYNNQIDSSIPVEQKATVEAPVNENLKKDFNNVQPEEIKVLENTKLLAEFSNLGGSLTKLTVKEYSATLPVTNVLNVLNYSDDIFHLKTTTENSLTYVYESVEFKILKTYTLSQDDYTLEARLTVENKGEQEKTVIEAFKLDINRLDKSVAAQDNSLYEYFILSPEITYRKAGAVKFSKKEARHHLAQVELLGFRDRYFSMILRPDFKTDEFIVDPVDASTLKINLVVAQDGNRGDAYNAVFYFGPQELGLLKKYKLGFEKAVVFSDWGWLDALAKGINNLMHWLYKIVPNWGLCIVFISFIIYGAMYPLTLSGMASMKRMQSLQPTMNRLREQHKNNPQRLNKEMMGLYKEHRVNPLGGCLPLFLQMPVFVSLYQVLWRSVEFKGAKFLWIKDLSEPDRLLILPFNLPMLGNELNILPFCMMAIMFVQQKLTAKNMVITDPAQETQQKMMTIVFPIFLGFIFYKFASGLSLYFTVFYLMSTLSQWKMSKPTKVLK